MLWMSRLRDHSISSVVLTFAVAIGLAMASGCTDAYPTSVDPGLLVVSGLLVVGAPEQTILIERTRSIDEGFLRATTGVPDAGVAVTAPDGSVHRFDPVPDSVGWYRATFQVDPGSEYRLRVVGPDGRTATGRTRTPQAPVLLEPVADTVMVFTHSIIGADVPMLWRSSACAGYVITYGNLAGRSPEENMVLLFYNNETVVTDTAGEAFLGMGQYPNGAVLSIAAVDSAYRHYAGPEPRETVPRSAARSTIDGGLGVFGSVAFSEARSVAVVFETP